MVVFPQPDSPTSPKVSPWRTEKDTSETAFTEPIRRWMTAPEVTGNSFTKSGHRRGGPAVGPSSSARVCWRAGGELIHVDGESADLATASGRLAMVSSSTPTWWKQAARWPGLGIAGAGEARLLVQAVVLGVEAAGGEAAMARWAGTGRGEARGC